MLHQEKLESPAISATFKSSICMKMASFLQISYHEFISLLRYSFIKGGRVVHGE